MQHVAGQFDLKLSLTSDFSSDLTTTLGTRQNAKIGKDDFDRSEPPTLGQTVAVYFDHKDWKEQPGLYNRDIQPILEIGEERTWNFTAFTDKRGEKMTLSWENAIEQVPDDTMLYFRRLDTDTQHETRNTLQDMREVQSVEITSDSLITKVPFEVKAKQFAMSPLEDLKVVAGEKQVAISWQANDNPFIESYTINRQRVSDASLFTFHVSRFTHQFLDTGVLEEATYTYQVTVNFLSGAKLESDFFTVTVLPVIKGTVLLQSYPNPFNPETWIPFELEEESQVTLEIYDVSGRLVRTLNLGRQQRGRYISKEKAVHWNGRNESGEQVANGIYFYVLKAGNFSATRRMAILK